MTTKNTAADKKTAVKKDPLLEEEIDQREENTAADKKTEQNETHPAQEQEVPVFNPSKKDKSEEITAKKVLTEQEQHTADLARFRKEIEKAPKTMFMVPLDLGEKAGAAKVVSLNGLAYTIKKGALVEIPIPIAEILAEQYEVEMTAGKEMLANRNDAVDDALN